MKFHYLSAFLMIFILVPSFASNIPNNYQKILKNSTYFSTWQGIEPDKWATIWLIKRFVSKDAYFKLIPPQTIPSKDAIPFGIPGVPIRRGNKQAMFHHLKIAMKLNEPELEQIDAIIHDMEVKIWEEPEHPYTPWIESLYRQLQARYNRDQVPVDCYLTFFDSVSELVVQKGLKAEIFEKKLNLETQCPGIAANKNTENNQELVRQINHLELLREISLGKKIVFIDTREDEEYGEVHLPGAKLLRLRDVNKQSVSPYKYFDLVVPYCVKDFRGFEVARAMKAQGVKNVATLSPNGLKGWLKAKLPVTKNNQKNEHPAIKQLMNCAMEPALCLGKMSG